MKPIRMINLHAHLPNLRSSLSPLALPESPLLKVSPAPDPTLPMRRLFIAFLIVFVAILSAYLSARQ